MSTCTDTIEILHGRNVTTPGIEAIDYPDVDAAGKRVGNIGGPDVLGCSLPANHGGWHNAHLNHDLTRPPLVTWRRSMKNEDLLRTARTQGGARTVAAVNLLIFLGKDIPVDVWHEGTWVNTEKLLERAGAWSGGERRLVSVAASLLNAGPCDLTDVIGGTGGEYRRAIITAIAAAAQIELAPVVIDQVPVVVDAVPHGPMVAGGPLTVAPDQIV
jgi:hypothetical protein